MPPDPLDWHTRFLIPNQPPPHSQLSIFFMLRIHPIGYELPLSGWRFNAWVITVMVLITCNLSYFRNTHVHFRFNSTMTDEVEVVNPIGSKVNTHKLGVASQRLNATLIFCQHLLITGLVYYTLGNLDPRLRSTLKSIHLLCVAKYSVIKKYGFEKILSPVIEDIQRLESVTS